MPDTGRRFEIDVDGGAGAARWVVFGAVILFWVVLLVWSPAGVHVPWFFWLPPAAVGGLLALLWWSRRPWTLAAVTAGYGEEPADQAVVVVRGRRRARKTMEALVDRLRNTGRLEDRDGDTAPMPATGEPDDVDA